MSYRQGNMEIDDIADGQAQVTIYNDTSATPKRSVVVFRGNREAAAQALAGDEFRVMSGSIVGNCPACKHPRLVLGELGRIRCTNPDCDDPNAALKALVDPDFRCRCGTPKTEDNSDCGWHATGGSHRGWVIVTAEEFATMNATIHELCEELRLSVEYVGIDVLQPWPGWGWYDSLKKHMPQFDEWLAKMPSRGTAHLATEASKHDGIDNVLATLHFAKQAVEDLEDDDFDDPVDNRAHIEQLNRLISACKHVRNDVESDDTAPPVDEGSDDSETLLGVVPPPGDDTVYPHAGLGDTVVLGPEVFAHSDETVINWKGENYYPRPVKPRREDTVEKQVEDLAEVFKKAWHAADERGETGRRTLHGIGTVLDTLDDTMFGERVDVSEVEPGDHVLAYFLEARVDPNSDESHYFLVEGLVHSVISGGLYVGPNQIRARTGKKPSTLEEVRRLNRAEPAEPEPDPDLVEGIRGALVDFAGEEMVITSGDLPYRLAMRLTAQLEEKLQSRTGGDDDDG